MTPREKKQKEQLGNEILRKLNENTRKFGLLGDDLTFIFKQLSNLNDNWNKKDDIITIEQKTELGKRYIRKILWNIKEAKKLSDEGVILRNEAIEYSTNQEDKDKIAATIKTDWDLYLKNYIEIYNNIGNNDDDDDEKMDDNEGEEWKR